MDIKKIKLDGSLYNLKDARIPAPQEADKDKYLHLNETTGAFEWDSPRGNVADVKQNGVSVVDAQGNANVTVPTKTSDINNDSGYITSAYHDNTKQDVIADLATIRSGAELGATAVQPEAGKGLSSNDYTDADKELVGTALQPNDSITNLAEDVSHRTVSDTEKATWNAKQSALTPDVDYATPATVQQDIADATADMATKTWVNNQGFIDNTYHDNTKQNVITDLATIRSGAEAGATAVQPAAIADMATKTWVEGKGYIDATYHDNAKQDVIADLADIRAGAALGETSVQPAAISDMATQTWVGQQEYITADDIPVLSVNGKTGTVVLTAADLGIGSVFDLKGSVATKTALPATGNKKGDVYYVINESVGYIWLNDGTTDRWEMLGMSVDLSNYVTTTALATALDGYVQKVAGKGLSTNDFTDTYKTKLDAAITSLAGYATEQWVEAKGYVDSTYHDSSKQNTITDLADIRAGAEAGATAVQPAAISDMATKTWVEGKGYVDNTYHDNTKQNTISDLATIRSGAGLGATAVQPEAGKGLFSGNYNDLSNKPTIPAAQVNSDWNATSGVAQILNKPTIPAEVTETTVAGWGFTKNTGTYSKPSTGIPKTDLATAVQTSLGRADSALQSYTETDPVFVASPAHGITSSDITNWNNKGTYSKPSGGIPKTDLAEAVQTSLGKADSAIQDVSGKEDKSNKVTDWSTTVNDTHYPSEKLVKNALDGKAAVTHNHTASEVTGLATVATTGSYNDLSNKPTIPAAQQQVNWNATSGITSIANKPNLATVATSGSYNDLSNKPTIPTVPSAGTTATAVSTTASGGSASTWSKSDHVHSIDKTTVTGALGYTPYNDTNPNGYTSNTGTVTSVAVKMNGSTKGTVTTSGTIDLGTVLTSHQSLSAYYTSAQTDTAIANAIGNAIGGAY